MKSKLSLKVFLLFVIWSIVSSCGELSRGQAEKMILEAAASNNVDKAIVYKFEVSPFNGKIRAHMDVYGDVVNKLIEKKYVTVDDYYMNLNDKIMPYVYIKGGNNQTVIVSFATINSVEVTGITGEDNYRSVECRLLYKLNDLGQDIGFHSDLMSTEGRYSFKKYDDGWRIN